MKSLTSKLGIVKKICQYVSLHALPIVLLHLLVLSTHILFVGN